MVVAREPPLQLGVRITSAKGGNLVGTRRINSQLDDHSVRIGDVERRAVAMLEGQATSKGVRLYVLSVGHRAFGPHTPSRSPPLPQSAPGIGALVPDLTPLFGAGLWSPNPPRSRCRSLHEEDGDEFADAVGEFA